MPEEKKEKENKQLMVLSEVNAGVRQTAITIDYSTVNYAKLESIYKTDQMVFQAVNIISTFAVSKGYEYIVDENNDEQLEMRDKISSFDAKVGLPKLLTDVVRHLHIYGNAYLEIVYSKTDEKKVVDLALIDPKTITFKKKATGEIDFDESGNIKGYVQTVNAKKIDLRPDQIIHFRINTIADSLTGTGIIEPLVKVIEAKRNIEIGLAEAVYRHGFPQFHVKLGDSEHQPTADQVTEESEKYKKINSKSEFVTPYYYDIKLLEAPSLKGGESYLKYFIDQMVAGTGVPKTILLGTGEGSNRATSFTQQQNFFLYVGGIQMLIAENLQKSLFGKILNVEESPVFMVFNSLQTKTDLELAQEREIYLRNGVLAPDEVRQEMGLDPISPPPNSDDQDVSNDSSGGFIFSEEDFLNDADLMLEEDEDFESAFLPIARNYEEADKTDYGGVLQELGQPIRSRFIRDQHILTHRINKIMDRGREKILKEIDDKLADENQSLAAEDLVIDSELLAPERDALTAAVFLDSKKKFKQGIKLGEEFIKKKHPVVAGIKVKSTVNEQAIRALDIRSTQLAKSVSGDLLKATQTAIREGLQARKGAKQLKEDIERVFEKFGGTAGRFNKVGTRAELIARTELHRSFIDGTLQSFRELKVEKLRMIVNVGACEQCLEVSADNQSVPLQLSVGIIPVHPRCRCGWVAAKIG
jgi:hypothetical protein